MRISDWSSDVCSSDLATRTDDPVLAQEVADFTHDCYGPSRAKLFMNRPTLTEEQMNDVTWIGSSYFLSTPGFYDTYRSKTPRTVWPYDATRDARSEERRVGKDGGSTIKSRGLPEQ